MVGVSPVVVDIVERLVTTYFLYRSTFFLECMFVFVTFAGLTIHVVWLKHKHCDEKNNVSLML